MQEGHFHDRIFHLFTHIYTVDIEKQNKDIIISFKIRSFIQHKFYSHAISTKRMTQI